MNKIFHHGYLTVFWICLEFWIYQCYTGFCRKQPVIQVWQVSQYSLGSWCTRAWIYKGFKYAKVLCKLYFKDFQHFECHGFGMCWGFECIRNLNMLYLRVLNVDISSYLFDRIMNIQRFPNVPGFWICQVSLRRRYVMQMLWQGSDYSSVSAYARVLNIPGLHKVLKKILHHRCLTEFQIFLKFGTCHGSK